jgi:hypothetical protein|tara:strand:+ start:341 stop:505 length:165 start_codon:yes stop_codon:yes gene_type:complete
LNLLLGTLQAVKVKKGKMIIYGKPLKEYFNFWPKWLWGLNIFAIGVGLLIVWFL